MMPHTESVSAYVIGRLATICPFLHISVRQCGVPHHLDDKGVSVDLPAVRRWARLAAAIHVLTGFAKRSQRDEIRSLCVCEADDRREAPSVASRLAGPDGELAVRSVEHMPYDVV